MQIVFYALGWLFGALALSLCLPLLVAAAFREVALVQVFFVTAITTGFLGGALILACKGDDVRLGRKESLFLAAMIWLIVPIPAMLPFLLVGQPAGLVNSYFEAVSAFTTTGATVMSDLSDTPRSLLFFRSFLQWLGGLATLLFFGLILGPLTGPERVDPRLRQINQEHLGSGRHFRQAAYTVFPIYSGLTVLCVLLLLVGGLPVFDSVCLSFSTLSTGGFLPRAGTISLYGSPFAEFVLAIFMFLGAVSVFWVRGLLQLHVSSISRTKEPVLVGGAIVVFGLFLGLMSFVGSPAYGVKEFYQSITVGLAAAASIITTTGYAVSSQVAEFIPYMLLLCLCLIGGGAFSTAGGLKVFRLIAMSEMVWRDLRRLIYPNIVRASDKNSLEQGSGTALVLAANFAVVVMAVGLIGVFLSVTDLPFQAAFLAAVGAISNVGPVFEQVEFVELGASLTYADLSVGGRLILCVGMIFGRVEVLALLALFNLAYWRS